MDTGKLYTVLVAGHPVTGSYDADDAVAAMQGNLANCSQDKTSLTGSEVYNAIDETEFESKTAEEKQKVWNILHLGSLNPHGHEADVMVVIFGPTSATITALKLLRVEAVSYATEEGLGFVRTGHVQQARA